MPKRRISEYKEANFKPLHKPRQLSLDQNRLVDVGPGSYNCGKKTSKTIEKYY